MLSILIPIRDEIENIDNIVQKFDDNLKNGWYLKDGRGTIQGHMCE